MFLEQGASSVHSSTGYPQKGTGAAYFLHLFMLRWFDGGGHISKHYACHTSFTRFYTVRFFLMATIDHHHMLIP